MPQKSSTLQHTVIFRSGATAKRHSFETNECSFFVKPEVNSLNIEFKLNSKGGGVTEVRVCIGVQDLPAILKRIAEEIPQSAVALSAASATASAIASEKILEQLNNLHLVLREKT
jgi:hypothetical protein